MNVPDRKFRVEYEFPRSEYGDNGTDYDHTVVFANSADAARIKGRRVASQIKGCSEDKIKILGAKEMS